MPPLVSALDNMTMALLTTGVPDENPVFLEDSVTSLQLAKVSTNDLYDKSFTIRGGAVRMPNPLSGLLTNTTDQSVILQVNTYNTLIVSTI